MTTTPPVRPIIEQPPTPLHGARYDFGESLSVRRSARFSNKSAARTPSPVKQSISPRSESLSSPRRTRRNYPSFAYSPPSSPSSPPTMARKRSKGGRSQLTHGANESENPEASTQLAADMLPTPAKTPSKNEGKPGLASAARVLFPKGPDPQGDPTPTRNRGRRYIGSSLESFGERGRNLDNKIEIFTDSKDQVPKLDESADNPFYLKKERAARVKKVNAESDHNRGVQEILKQDEGMIYVFRGKKIYRKFEPVDNDKPPHGLDSATDGLSLDRFGSPHHFTRSSVKPRLLFPTRQRQRGDTTDEEAVTDIDDTQTQREAATPAKSNYHPATPPETARTKRKAPTKTDLNSSPTLEEELLPPRFPGKRNKKSSPFQGWQRIKPGQTPIETNRKRGADDLEMEAVTVSKRVRSGDFPP